MSAYVKSCAMYDVCLYVIIKKGYNIEFIKLVFIYLLYNHSVDVYVLFM